ncbi:hypothetical protein GCM10009425_38390 [Pseudomonas asuensis]|uniref:DUF4113 domain-containing protein n=1 Tax=Pseudomonas asuensis TaxID=1825787 RepID=A0ABQ2H1W9_9PSED|nr:hypothetical protein GCM10009425_38390 [Pseudomonas asuensis]
MRLSLAWSMFIEFSKAEVFLMDLRQRGEYSDAINAKWERNTQRPGCVTTALEWDMRRDMMSQSFTTRIDRLWLVQCK